ncbi:MAG: di-heme oxidoredictase family protein, partial [Blastocatellia bacterium]
MTKHIKLIVLMALCAGFALRPGNTAAQYNQPGLSKTLTFPGSETPRATRTGGARRAARSFDLPIPAGATEAPTGLDKRTNGLVPQEKFDEAAEEFAAVDTVAEGLGPLRNGDSCADCHRSPFGGFGSTIEINAGHNEKRSGKTVFVAAQGGTIIALFSTDPEFQERVPESENLRSLRTTLSILGLGFLEAISLQTRSEIAQRQVAETNGRIHGAILMVQDPEAPGGKSPGVFGHKGAVPRLDLFAAGAYQVEMGITNPRFPTEQTSLGRSVASIDPAPDPEDDGEDVELFAIFMRASLAPSRSPLATTPTAKNGAKVFEEIGCARCHVPTLVTA